MRGKTTLRQVLRNLARRGFKIAGVSRLSHKWSSRNVQVVSQLLPGPLSSLRRLFILSTKRDVARTRIREKQRVQIEHKERPTTGSSSNDFIFIITHGLRTYVRTFVQSHRFAEVKLSSVVVLFFFFPPCLVDSTTRFPNETFRFPFRLTFHLFLSSSFPPLTRTVLLFPRWLFHFCAIVHLRNRHDRTNRPAISTRTCRVCLSFGVASSEESTRKWLRSPGGLLRDFPRCRGQ